MPILNYTTQISASKSIGEIQKKLSKAGASAVMIEYGPSGEESALSFRFAVDGSDVYFNLPANTDAIYNVLQRTCAPRYATRKQASNVAWRILKDWVEAQLAVREAGLVELIEVFLPYAQTGMGGKTVYQLFKDKGFKGLKQLEHHG